MKDYILENAIKIVEREIRAINTYLTDPDMITQKDRLIKNKTAFQTLLNYVKKSLEDKL